jgi:hypothetical protein
LARTEDRTAIGWHGISVMVPAEWALGGVGGDRKAGHLRVDDQLMPRLQVKWSHARLALERKRDEYAKRLEFGKRKRPTGIEVDTEVRFLSRRAKPKKELVTFAWRGPQCRMGLLWNCEVCGLGVMAQVVWRPNEEYHEVAREVLESLEDHGRGGWRMWGLDGLAFWAPESYQLARWKRLTGHLELRLAEGASRLKVSRWGMVPQVLEGRTVVEWFREENGRRRDVVLGGEEEAEIKGHPGVAAWGSRWRVAGSVRNWAARALKRRPAVEFAAWGWHCAESNRLYLVESVEARAGQVLKGVVDSVVCHGEA